MKETFIIRTEWQEAIFELKPLEQATIFQNLFHFHSGNNQRINLKNLSVKLVWKLIEPNLTRNIDSYDKRRDTSSENGKKGGRPNEIVTTINGKIIPSQVEGQHFSYLIFDTETGFYKVGETSDLLKRRLSIKRPTNFLKIVEFAVNSNLECYKWEANILKQFNKERISGDWLQISNNQVSFIESTLNNLNKPTQKPIETEEPIESLLVSDSVSDSVSVNETVVVGEPEKPQAATTTNISFSKDPRQDKLYEYFYRTTMGQWAQDQISREVAKFMVAYPETPIGQCGRIINTWVANYKEEEIKQTIFKKQVAL